MSKNEPTKKAPFVKYHLALTYLLSPSESRFILHMLEVSYMNSVGYDIYWSKAYYMKRMQLNEYTFNKCVSRLEVMGLIIKTKNSQNDKVHFSLNTETYHKLLSILTLNKSIDKLIEFRDAVFGKNNRSIDSITEEEICILTS